MKNKKLEWIYKNIGIVIVIVLAIMAVIWRNNTVAFPVLIALIAMYIAIKAYQIDTKIEEKFDEIDSISKNMFSIKETVKHLTAVEVLKGREECFRKLNCIITENSKVDVTYLLYYRTTTRNKTS